MSLVPLNAQVLGCCFFFFFFSFLKMIGMFLKLNLVQNNLQKSEQISRTSNISENKKCLSYMSKFYGAKLKGGGVLTQHRFLLAAVFIYRHFSHSVRGGGEFPKHLIRKRKKIHSSKFYGAKLLESEGGVLTPYRFLLLAAIFIYGLFLLEGKKLKKQSEDLKTNAFF